MKHFFKKTLSLALAVLFTLGAVSATAFVGLLPAVAEGESTLGATAACSGHNLGTFNDLPACVNADGELHICGNNFPDDNFRNYVLNGGFDTENNGYFSASEIESVKEIRCENSNIVSLQGIEFFNNLTVLKCYSNQIVTVDVSKNAALTELWCSNNQLTTLDVSNNTALTTLSCGSNQLGSLDVSNNVKLTELSCYDSQLTSLDVSNNVELTELHCNNNQLTTLDVSNNAALTTLSCISNQLTSLDVGNNTKLTSLFCNNNQLTSLDISNNVELTVLYCYDNQLTSLDVSNNTTLATLRCDSNQLTSLDVSNNVKLTDLNCYGNQLTTLDVSNNTALSSLSCGYNQLTSLDVSNNTALSELSCGGNQLASLDVRNNAALSSLNCFNNQLASLDVRNNANLIELWCYTNQLTSLDVSNNAALTTLWCSGNQLTSLDVSNNVKLRNYACKYQKTSVAVTDQKSFDMHALISEENLSNVTIDSDIGTYDPETGIIVFNEEQTSFKYYYGIGKNDATMDVTVTLKMHEHTYGDYVSNGDGTHTRHCTFDGCTDTETENCSGGSATCKDKAVCEICGEAYGGLDPENHTGKEVWEQTETKHTKKWNCCGAVTVPEADHEFEDGVCTVCAYPCAHKDDNTDHLCDICGVTVSEHIDSDNNHLCDICGETVSNHSDENHDHICDLCGETISAHTGGTATCKDKAVCEICGEEYGELNPENHTGGTHIEHEKAATCTEKGYTGDTYCNGCNAKISDGSEIPTKPHTPGEKWVIENGKKVKKCTECGAIAETAPRMPGDVDGDGEITMLDCLYLKRYILGTFSGEIVLENADVDGNGKIDATDYLYLKRGYLGTFDLSQFA